jgi:hypothetical protein
MDIKKVSKALVTYLMTAPRGDMGEKAVSIIMAVGFIGIFGWIILYCMSLIQSKLGLSGTPFDNAAASLTDAVTIGFDLQTIIIVIMVFGVVIGGLYYMWNKGRNQE